MANNEVKILTGLMNLVESGVEPMEMGIRVISIDRVTADVFYVPVLPTLESVGTGPHSKEAIRLHYFSSSPLGAGKWVGYGPRTHTLVIADKLQADKAISVR